MTSLDEIRVQICAKPLVAAYNTNWYELSSIIAQKDRGFGGLDPLSRWAGAGGTSATALLQTLHDVPLSGDGRSSSRKGDSGG